MRKLKYLKKRFLHNITYTEIIIFFKTHIKLQTTINNGKKIVMNLGKKFMKNINIL